MAENAVEEEIMALYRAKAIAVDATLWFKNGDHPQDNSQTCFDEFRGEIFLTEGKVVRRFRNPDVRGDKVCCACNCRMHDHGWIDRGNGGHIVCPGDFVITDEKGQYYPCKPNVFYATYGPAQGDPTGEKP